MKARDTLAPGGIQIAGESLHLLRLAPPHVTAAYFIGTIPFVFGLLYFWSDMSRSAFAHERCLGAALGLALLFVWMKAWQALFGSGLHAFILGRTPPRWTLRLWVRQAIVQTALQWHGFLTIPIAILVMFPLPAVYAFYQNVTILAGDENDEPAPLARRSWRLGLLWPAQNSVIIWLLSPWFLGLGLAFSFGMVRAMVSMMPDLYDVANLLWFILSLMIIATVMLPFSFLGCLIAGNIAVFLISVPWLLQFLFGIETAFSLSSWQSIFNTTFIMTVYALSYLCMDPLVKAAYTLRCFYGESLHTGDDLRVELANGTTMPPPTSQPRPERRPGRTAMLLLLAILCLPVSPSGSAMAADAAAAPASTSVSSTELDRAIGQTIARPEYSWRLPREREIRTEAVSGFWDRFFISSGEWLKEAFRKAWRWTRRVARWLEEAFTSKDPSAPMEMDWNFVGWLTVYLAAILVCSFVGILFYRMWKARGRRPAALAAEPVTITTEMLDDTAVAEKLPSDEWMNLARRLLERGEIRLALRAMFLASLAFLAHHGRLTIARHKSNREYMNELRRKSHDHPLVLEAFAENVDWIEQVWYGDHPAVPALVDRLSANLGRLSSQLTEDTKHFTSLKSP